MTTLVKQGAFEAFIGPRYVPGNATETRGKFNFPDELQGLFVPLRSRGKQTLVSTLSAVATTGLSLTPNGFGSANYQYPTEGGVWVGPNAAGEGWEFIAYNASGGSLIRNPQRGASNVHTAGAPVYFWFPLNMNDGNLSVTHEESENMAIVTWTARLSGVRAPSQVLKPDHFIAITHDNAFPVNQNIDGFEIFLFGIVDRVRMVQDNEGRGTWEIEITSIARALQGSTVPGLRVGPMDIALQADASASSSLGAAWKLTMPQQAEAQAGNIPEIDLIEVQDDMGPQNAVDGNDSTLWVSDGWLADPALFANSPGHNSWASIFAYPHPLTVVGSRYIEIIHHDILNFTWMWYYQKYTATSGVRARWIQISSPGMFGNQGIEETDLSGNEDRVVVAENAEVFRRLFPSAKPKFLIDAAELSGPQDQEAARRLWWEEGAIFMAWDVPLITQGEGYLWMWGTSGATALYDEIETAWDTQGTSDFNLPGSNFYLDVTGIRPGEVFRRVLTQAIDPPQGQNTMSYVHDYIHHPGYVIDNNPGGNFPEWFKVTLPEMTHVLAADITAATTTIYLVDAQGFPNVEGISRLLLGGSIMIDEEIIPFTSKDYDLGTLTGCTVTIPHKAGSRVYVMWDVPWYGTINNTAVLLPVEWRVPFYDKKFKMATAGFPLRYIRWGRGRYSNGVERTPYIGNFVIRFSAYDDARVPPAEHHESDYFSELIVDSNSFTPNISNPNPTIDIGTNSFFDTFDATGFRPRSIIMEMRSVNKTGTGDVMIDRPRLNYFNVEVDRDYFNPATWVDLPPAGLENYLFVSYVLAMSGMYVSAITASNPGGAPSLKRWRGMTDRDSAWRIASDAAEYGSTVINVTRLGSIYVQPNLYLLSGSHPVVKTLTEALIQRLEIVNIRPSDLGQMRVKWEEPVSGKSGIATYPDEAPSGTEVVEVGPLLANDDAQALLICTNLYETRRYAYNIFIELRNYDYTIEVGHIHNVVYDWNKNGEVVDRILRVESIQYEFSNREMVMVIGYREIEKGVP